MKLASDGHETLTLSFQLEQWTLHKSHLILLLFHLNQAAETLHEKFDAIHSIPQLSIFSMTKAGLDKGIQQHLQQAIETQPAD